MRALTWHGMRDVRVEQVPDPDIREPILGHEWIGVVKEVGSGVRKVSAGEAPGAYEQFQKKEGGCFQVVLTP